MQMLEANTHQSEECIPWSPWRFDAAGELTASPGCHVLLSPAVKVLIPADDCCKFCCVPAQSSSLWWECWICTPTQCVTAVCSCIPEPSDHNRGLQGCWCRVELGFEGSDSSAGSYEDKEHGKVHWWEEQEHWQVRLNSCSEKTEWPPGALQSRHNYVRGKLWHWCGCETSLWQLRK